MRAGLANIRDPKAQPVGLLLACGIASAGLYVIVDIVAALLYPGYDYRDQAVSELFAIGAPTSGLVVPLFSLSSLLLIPFAFGIASRSPGHGASRLLAFMFTASAFDALILWNVFPMHMRGDERTFTDQMHLILAANPFVIATLVVAIFAFRDFRIFSSAILTAVLLLAVAGFGFASALNSGQPTPDLGLIERLGQYLYQFWQIALALKLSKRRHPDMLGSTRVTP